MSVPTINTLAFGIKTTNPPFPRFPVSLESLFSQSPILTPLFSLRAIGPCRTKQPLKPSSVAAPAAVERVNVEGASRHSRACPIGSSRTRLKVTFMGPSTHLES
jgi:hypothetical protein